MITTKFTFTQFAGCYVQGSTLCGTVGFIKRYVSKAMAEKTVAKIKESGIDCKAVQNRKSWAIVAV